MRPNFSIVLSKSENLIYFSHFPPNLPRVCRRKDEKKPAPLIPRSVKNFAPVIVAGLDLEKAAFEVTSAMYIYIYYVCTIIYNTNIIYVYFIC